MSWILRIVLLVITTVLLIIGVMAFNILNPGPTVSLHERLELLKPGIEMKLPEGSGPHPAVLMFHGCGGLVGEHGEKDILQNYARTAAKAGYAAVVVDSLRPRGVDFQTAVKRVCSGRQLRGRLRAGDVLAALEYAADQPEIDASRLILAGWSHGGWTVMDLMTMDMDKTWPVALEKPASNLMDGVIGIYLTYPFCGFPALSHKKPWIYQFPTSVIVAENDDVVQLGRCAETLIKLDAEGIVLEVEIFEDVTHAFDESDHTAKSSFSYSQAATSHAHKRFESFLRDMKTGAPFPNPSREKVRLDETAGD